LDSVSEALGVDITADNVEETLAQLGSIAAMVTATLSHTTNPSMLNAGYKVNVIPGQATAGVDGRFLPGERDQFVAEITRLIGQKVRLEILHEQPGVEADMDTALTAAMAQAIHRHDPGARVTPYLLSAGTDAKSWDSLGIQCYGFVPLKLPADLDFVGMFHGVDERVPIDALRFGCQVFDDFLDLV
jgi:acetylornithine deacetylase/succinyl-diaminopimelate desuccinylase-like protein